MNYREVTPRPPLDCFVKCLWFLESAAPAGGVECVVPDGCAEIVINLADPFRGVALNRLQPRVMAVGQIRRFLHIAPTGVVRLVGIRFLPAGLRSFVPLDMGELTDERPALGDIDARLAVELHDAARTGVARIEEVLLARLRKRRGPIEEAVRAIRDSRGTVRIDDVCRRTGLGARQLERGFRKEVGVPPKLLARVVRFQHVITTVEETARLDWAAIALSCGYYDQAHLIRDFRRFAGMSPGRYFATEHPLADFFSSGGLSDSSNPGT